MKTMKTQKTKFLCMLLAGAMMLALSGCGGSSSNESAGTTDSATDNAGLAGETADVSDSAGETLPGSNVFKLGGTGPLTGGAAIYGNAAKNGAQIAVDEINASESPIKFILSYEDDSHDPEKAANAYNTLKDWGMQISLGSVTSTPAEVTSAETFADRIFALTPSASSLATVQGKDNVFQMCFTDPGQGAKSAEYISEQNLGERIAIIWKNDDVYSKGIRDTFVEEAAVRGLVIVSESTFNDANATDFSVQIGEAQQANADLVFLPMYYEPAALIFSQASATGYTPKWFGVDGMDGILTMDGFDTSLAEGVMLLTPFNADAQDARTVNFVQIYQTRYGETPNQFAADAYDCVYAFCQALANSGATSNMSVSEINDLMIEQFTTMTFSGLTGDEITWETTGEVSKSPRGMVIQNGAYVGMD